MKIVGIVLSFVRLEFLGSRNANPRNPESEFPQPNRSQSPKPSYSLKPNPKALNTSNSEYSYLAYNPRVTVPMIL